MNPVSETAALLTLVVSAMVKDKAAVKVKTVSGLGHSIVFVLEVAQRDRGKVLGKHGKMAHSLRFVLMSIGKQNGSTFLLDIPDAPADLSLSAPRTGWSEAEHDLLS